VGEWTHKQLVALSMVPVGAPGRVAP